MTLPLPGPDWETEYPRPQMKRSRYLILNGEWQLNGKPIQLPFPPESRRSGYPGPVEEKLAYKKHFRLPEGFAGEKDRIFLHFGAVDQKVRIRLNSIELARHTGGYLPFTVDITDALCEGENKLCVDVVDTLSHDYPYGKQHKKPHGMWYTPVSGIWQTVWLEAVPAESAVRSLRITSGQNQAELSVETDASWVTLTVFPPVCRSAAVPTSVTPAAEDTSAAYAHSTEDTAATCASSAEDAEELPQSLQFIQFSIPQLLHMRESRRSLKAPGCVDADEPVIGHRFTIDLKKEGWTPRLWTPEEPWLYPIKIQTTTDCVESYFALRTIEVQEIDGKPRVCLNGQPVFLHGVLDQGYFTDGLYLPGEPAEYLRDIRRMKELGFTLLRKHVKIEPEIYYYACDREGMLVMQDMVQNGGYNWFLDTALPNAGLKRRPDRLPGRKLQKEIFEQHMKDTLEQLYNHPCIIAYTIFNEGWGQFDSDRLYRICRKQDATRLFDSTSGWFSQQESDFDSVHAYFRNRKLHGGIRPLLLSECGGYARRISGHLYQESADYGYGKTDSEEDLTRRMEKLYEEMVLPSIPEGLCGCIYTQLSDVEAEINGLYTYDRRICKVDTGRLQEIARKIRECGESL